MLVDVIGQDFGVAVLRRVADRKYRSPLLLVGEEGTGRRYAVLQTAKEVFCKGDRTSGCACYDCFQIDEGSHADLAVVQPESGREIKIDQIRDLIEKSTSYPSIAPLRILVVDGADLLNTAGANALLKTLEEHHPTTRFFLLAERANRVIPTIRSRCGIVRFQALPESFIFSAIQASPAAPSGENETSNLLKSRVYARMGEGSVGRAIGYLGAGKLGLRDKVVSLIKSGVRKDLPSVFSIVNAVEKELRLGLRFLVQLLFDLIVVSHSPDRIIHMDLLEDIRQLRSQVQMDVLYKLSVGARRILDLSPSANINFPFHVQNLFVETFFRS